MKKITSSLLIFSFISITIPSNTQAMNDEDWSAYQTCNKAGGYTPGKPYFQVSYKGTEELPRFKGYVQAASKEEAIQKVQNNVQRTIARKNSGNPVAQVNDSYSQYNTATYYPYSSSSYSSSPSVSYQYSGGSHTYDPTYENRVNKFADELLDDCRRIHQRDTGRNFDRDVQENCVIQ